MTSSTPTRSGAILDSPPPAAGRKSTSLMEMESERDTPPSPQAAVMLGMNMVEQGSRLISMSLPQIAPAMQQLITQLRDVLPRAMAESPTGAPIGGQVGGPAAVIPPPGGGMPSGGGMPAA